MESKEYVEFIKEPEVVNFSQIFSILRDELDSLSDSTVCLELLAKLDTRKLDDETKETLETIKIAFANHLYEIEKFHRKWEKYTRAYGLVANKSLRDSKIRIDKANKEYDFLLGKYNELKGKEDKLDKITECLNETLYYLNSMKDVFEKIQSNTKLIANVDFARKKMVSGSPTALKAGIDNNELVELYKKNNHMITEDMLKYFNTKEKITYHGLRARLQKLGEWKGGYHNDKK